MNERKMEVLAYGVNNILLGVKSIELLTTLQLQIYEKCKELNDLLVQASVFPASASNIIDRKEYLAVKAWSKEDIVDKMVEMGYEPLTSTIEKICQNTNFEYLVECSDADWNFIEDAIKENTVLCNTRIDYTYRVAANFKKENSCIIHGLFSLEQLDEICDCCDYDGETFRFIPSQVGLPEERFVDIGKDDHCWFELGKMSHTALLSTVDVDVDTLVKSFSDAKDKWDDTKFKKDPLSGVYDEMVIFEEWIQILRNEDFISHQQQKTYLNNAMETGYEEVKSEIYNFFLTNRTTDELEKIIKLYSYIKENFHKGNTNPSYKEILC